MNRLRGSTVILVVATNLIRVYIDLDVTGRHDNGLRKGEHDMLGYDIVGVGPRKVMILNDWLCDTSTWDAARAYLDGSTFTWVFADLRGYGQSIDRTGTYTLAEAAADVLGVATTHTPPGPRRPAQERSGPTPGAAQSRA